MIRNTALEAAVAREIRRMNEFMNDYTALCYTKQTAELLIEELQHAVGNLLEFCMQQHLHVNYN